MQNGAKTKAVSVLFLGWVFALIFGSIFDKRRVKNKSLVLACRNPVAKHGKIATEGGQAGNSQGEERKGRKVAN